MNQELENSGKKKGGGSFMRKGQVGDWRRHFSPELEVRFKEWETKWLDGCSLKFDHGD